MNRDRKSDLATTVTTSNEWEKKENDINLVRDEVPAVRNGYAQLPLFVLPSFWIGVKLKDWVVQKLNGLMDEAG
ncbi:unnamed protein product [Caenorhabditis auriculariae]|uniref:Uncharacterized protein n=1 Tax=Caenorhabditis auriculariae TaxID=2777116 RepID=A0A8S1HF10_9PELO|nr:unnamed protein product [Caenorhabditis auriculariae]